MPRPSSSSSSSGSSRSSVRRKTRQLPDTPPVNAMIYFCCQNPKKVKGVRAYYYDDDFETRSNGSYDSLWSWGSSRSNVSYGFVYGNSWEEGDYGDNEPQGGPRPGVPPPPPGWVSRGATVVDDVSTEDDDDDSDGSSDDGSAAEYGHPAGPPGGGGPFMPGLGQMGMQMPPQGGPAAAAAFGKPVRRMPPVTPHPQMTGATQMASHPRTAGGRAGGPPRMMPMPHPAGFSPAGRMGPPPPPPPPGAPGGGHFVQHSNGMKVFMN
ncbi:hypothetical protein QBC43DRAFT_343007 [Cladorrhinum sp. PSN259]|nr:hypothetical protein QBC43DRAFT_343007 [Cladorrhinum sp. PSN259]